MTLTLEIAPGVEKALETEAQRHGQSVNDYATALIFEALEDAADIADAEHIIANSDPSKRHTLDELRDAIAELRGAKAA